MDISTTSITTSNLFKKSQCTDCDKSSPNQNALKTEEEIESTSPEEKELKKASASPEDRLTEEQIKQVEELKARDQEVRTHEAAHLAAAGQHAKGGPTFDYQQGPDGKRYAVGGEVQIDTSKVPNDPEATIQKARQIRAAAMAPAEPSSQDRQVAAQAVQMESQARAELQNQQLEVRASNKEKMAEKSSENSGQEGKLDNANSPATAYQKVSELDPNKSLNIFDFVV